MQSVGELEENLATYREQLGQVHGLLDLEPDNDEYKEMAAGLKEVIELTEDLLSTAKQHAAAQEQPGTAADAPSAGAPLAAPSFVPASSSAAAVPGEDAGYRLQVGASVQAVWSGDDEWRGGVIDSVTKGGYMVRFESDVGNGQQFQEVREMRVRRVDEDDEAVQQRAREAMASVEQQAEETRLALKRKLAEAAQKEIVPKEIPAKLRIKPEDSEDVRAEKRRKVHAMKSKQRLENLELIQNKKTNSWQQFQVKGKQKKAGFFTGKKKDSIFKTPDDPHGKVGVVGSGKGMTDFQQRGKYSSLKEGGGEGEEE